LPDCPYTADIGVAGRPVTRYRCFLKRSHPGAHDLGLADRPTPGYYWVKPKNYPGDHRYLTVCRVDEQSRVTFTGIDSQPPLDDILRDCVFVAKTDLPDIYTKTFIGRNTTPPVAEAEVLSPEEASHVHDK
jgi:hypothetical protein